MEFNCFHVFYRTWLCIWVTWRVSYKKQELLTLREHLRVFYGVRVAHLFCFFVLYYYLSLRSEFRVVLPVTIFAWKRCSVRLYLQLFVGGRMSYLCFFVHSGFHHILCFVFVLFFIVLCTICCQTLRIVLFWLSLRYSLTFILE